jgi:hypothetical protein
MAIQSLVWGSENGFISVFKMDGGDFNSIAKSTRRVETFQLQT